MLEVSHKRKTEASENSCLQSLYENEKVTHPHSNVLCGDKCTMATSDYHGRKWTVWFTPEIPLSFGPWKFRGLPGLILKAEADGGFSFNATGLQTTDRIMSPMYSESEYSKISRTKAQEDHEFFLNNLFL